MDQEAADPYSEITRLRDELSSRDVYTEGLRRRVARRAEHNAHAENLGLLGWLLATVFSYYYGLVIGVLTTLGFVGVLIYFMVREN